jgi:hypothetical protein
LFCRKIFSHGGAISISLARALSRIKRRNNILRVLDNPGYIRKIVTNRALALDGPGWLARTASLTIGELYKKILLVQTIKNLPPLKTGYVRLIHKTDVRSAEAIRKTGLRYGGHVESTAFMFENASDANYYLKTCRNPIIGSSLFYYPRERAVVFDLPIEEFEDHNRFKEWGNYRIPAKYIVGVLDTSHQVAELRDRKIERFG